jgi:hypothetical protein
MEPQHEQPLKDILSKSPHDFTRWVDSLSDKEIDYVVWLLDKAEDALDDLLFEQFGLVEAQYVIESIMRK